MTQRRVQTGLSGILALDKPKGMTSHDVVNTVRRVTGERRVGHAGTLDPMATGLLLVCVGPATRLADYLMAGIKTYEARICFGRATTTDDAEGETRYTGELPQGTEDAEYASSALKGMIGVLDQMPPAFSAIKKHGITAYKAARAGEPLALEPRRVELYDAVLCKSGKDYWDVALTVSKGFYVRSFARDLGTQLGSAAHLGALRRTASGPIDVSGATQLDTLAAGESLPFIDPVGALGLPVFAVNATQACAVQNGRALTLAEPKTPAPYLVSVVHEQRLLALYEGAGGGLAHPRVVIPGGVSLRCGQDLSVSPAQA